MTLFKNEPRTQVVAAVEADAPLREAFCKDFGIKGYATLDALLAAEKFNIAAIFLPHADCPAAAEKCAAAGAHLMVEKPVAASSTGAQAIVAAAHKHHVALTTGYAWRFHPVARDLKQIIADGRLGRIVAAEGRCAAGKLQRYIDGHAEWILQKARSGGGPMYNLRVHWIDLFRWMLADEVVEVSGQNVKVNTQYDIEDNSFAHLRFSRGAVAALDISYTVPDAYPYGRDLYISVRGTQGVAQWSPAYEGQKDALVLCSDHASFAGSPRVVREYELEPTPGYSGFMGKAYLNNFVDSILNQTPLMVAGEDGVAALKIVEAVYRADKEKKWVSI
jgi:predicted dehydrogenase